ncbi:hypothetical protein ACLVWU_13680 [Bdellovibrio sp. HCB290]|uniref:hypothetical protein n=1 Tax=Bdellovibrio sp. HCB290 TaxID=3394356 RepID=UPI0039B3D3D6
MKSLSVLVLGCLLSVTSFAAPSSGRVAEKADRVAMELRYRGHELSDSQLDLINKNLDSIRRVLDGDLDQGSELRLICISRDNDGRSPYVLAKREGVNTIRSAAVYSSIQDCENAIRTARVIGDRALVCSSKDDDGREPTVLTLLWLDASKKIPYSVTTQADCADNLKMMRPDRSNTVTFCASKDGDSRNPFIAVSLNLNNNSVQKSTAVFNTISECRQFLK